LQKTLHKACKLQPRFPKTAHLSLNRFLHGTLQLRFYVPFDIKMTDFAEDHLRISHSNVSVGLLIHPSS